MTSHEVQRILIQIEQMDDPESLKEIGRAAASQLKVLGVNAHWGKSQENFSLGRILVLFLVGFVIVAFFSLVIWTVPFDETTARWLLQFIVLLNGYNFAYWFVERF